MPGSGVPGVDALTGWQIAAAWRLRPAPRTDRPVVYLDSAFGLFLAMVMGGPVVNLAALGRRYGRCQLLEEAAND
jgi:hypothetical protein